MAQRKDTVQNKSDNQSVGVSEIEINRPAPMPEVLLAEALVQQESKAAHTPLFKRSKSIAVLLVLSIVNVVMTGSMLFSEVRDYDGFTANVFTLISAVNLPLFASLAGYLSRAVDPSRCNHVLKLFLICITGELLIGFYSDTSLILIVATLITTVIAYTNTSLLRRNRR